MIATPKPAARHFTAEHQRRFVEMLPAMLRILARKFEHQSPESREDLIAEALAAAYAMFVSLVRRGRESLAYPTPLATFGARHARAGRKLGTPTNSSDVLSQECQAQHEFAVERLDVPPKRLKGRWTAILVEDRHAGPAETAAARIDFDQWLRTLSRRNRRLAESLALGEPTHAAAKRFGISWGRVSQLRRVFKDSWERFQGDQQA